METIIIRWTTGGMEINPAAFFPTSAARVRKLLRVISLDYDHQDDIRERLARYCTERAQELLDSQRAIANDAVNNGQKVVDLQEQIDFQERQILKIQIFQKEQPKAARTMRCGDRLKTEKAKLTALKEEQRAARSTKERKKREFAQVEKAAKQLQLNAEVIRP